MCHNEMKSFLVYKFTCASCSCNYIGETCRHFNPFMPGGNKKATQT